MFRFALLAERFQSFLPSLGLGYMLQETLWSLPHQRAKLTSLGTLLDRGTVCLTCL